MRVTSGANSNELTGAAGNVVQGRDFHGDIHFHRGSWLWPVAFVVACLVVAGVIVFWPDGDDGDGGLRVSVDLTVGEPPPWAFAAATTDFPGAALAERLARPYSPREPGLQDALRAAGGVSVERQTVRLHLVGPDDGSVRVVDIRPVVRKTAAPVDGVLVHVPGQGVETSANLHLYLDDDVPVLQDTAEGDQGERVPAGPFFPGSTINLAAGETQEVVLTVFAHNRGYEYELAVEYQAGTDTHVVTVDDGGRPLRVTGLACASPDIAAYDTMYDLVPADFSIQPIPAGAPQTESEC